MIATRLRTEYLDAPLGLGVAQPRFSWWFTGGISQSAYRILAVRDGETVWDSGCVESSRTNHIRYEGVPLGSRDLVEWSVTVWDENGISGEPARSRFELGLLDPACWVSRWITAPVKQKGTSDAPSTISASVLPLAARSPPHASTRPHTASTKHA